ncbi:transmembrane protein 272-like [Ylistrum balloti]|uniref:transmembrane protein 272-like n=1 Tax=Ylistrum balloti TaxID=509963 RepID=UPI002905C26D|nr:transmembrane protein 272-like [Ylistrum balloti]
MNESPASISSRDVERNASPPTYDSLYGKLKAASEGSKGKVDFAKTSIGIICGSLLFLICIVISLAFPLAKIAIGSLYFYDCPAQRLIPIYLIVAGVFGTLKGIELIGQNVESRKDQSNRADENPTNPADGILNLFLLAWFICGNVWVYGLKDEWVSSPSTAGNYCNPTLFYFSFWSITLIYISFGIVCLFSCIGLIVINCVANKN